MSIEGRNLFQWRREYIDLAGEFVKYAWHTVTCNRYGTDEHKHVAYKQANGIDMRAMCSELPCTCGLLVILSVMLHPHQMGFVCPDVPTRVQPHPDADTGIPQTLWGIPIIESDSVPQGTIEVGYGKRMRVRLTNIGDNRFIVEDIEPTAPKQEVLGIDTDPPEKV